MDKLTIFFCRLLKNVWWLDWQVTWRSYGWKIAILQYSDFIKSNFPRLILRHLAPFEFGIWSWRFYLTIRERRNRVDGMTVFLQASNSNTSTSLDKFPQNNQQVFEVDIWFEEFRQKWLFFFFALPLITNFDSNLFVAPFTIWCLT